MQGIDPRLPAGGHYRHTLRADSHPKNSMATCAAGKREEQRVHEIEHPVLLSKTTPAGDADLDLTAGAP